MSDTTSSLKTSLHYLSLNAQAAWHRQVDEQCCFQLVDPCSGAAPGLRA